MRLKNLLMVVFKALKYGLMPLLSIAPAFPIFRGKKEAWEMNIQKLNNKYVALVIGLSFLGLTSCAAVVAGGAGAAAAYTYVSGWLTRDYDTSLDTAYQASLKSLQENNIKIVERSKEVASANIKAETPEQTYWVKIEEKGAKLTTVSVRAGLIGDRPSSEKVHKQIEQNI